MKNNLTPFFSPRGVAIVGASSDPTKLGYGLARNLAFSNYQGAIYYVNPRCGSLFGRPVYPDLASVPDPVDLAILLIPAPATPEALRACAARGLIAVVIGAGGFRETGPQGAALEDECVQIARQNGIRLLGPNSIGLLDTHLPLDATFLPPPGPLPGEVALISHSGAICLAVIDWARGQNFGLSRLVSLGNQADISETDMLIPVAADPYTRVITLYLEGVRDGRRFVTEAGQISREKPIIALKAGRFSGGQRAVASHTGALAGSENAYNAAFRRAGVVRADTSPEMFDWARALAWCPLPRGRNVAVLTNAGGAGALAADAVELNGLHLVELSQTTRAGLAEILPAAASLHNPVDMLASGSPEQYAACLSLLLNDPQVDSVLVVLLPPPMYTAGAVAKSLIPIIHGAEKPVIIALMGERLIQEAVEHFRAGRVPEYRFPERAASALRVLAERAEYLARPEKAATPDLPENTRALVDTILRRPVVQVGENRAAQQILSAEECQRILNAYGIPTPEVVLAYDAQMAASVAQAMGFPVALKIASSDVSHKSDVGGVMLNLLDQAQVEHGFNQMLENVRAAQPEATIQGVHVQRMIPVGQEVIVGAIQDSQFGPLAMFGSGGVEVEGLGDIRFGLAPLTLQEANEMIDGTWAGRKLRGFRNIPPADREAALQALLNVAQLASDYPELAEIEINPLRVLPAGHGVTAIDIRLILKRI
jgi:acetate---CoA ligase (ADP-forming)